MNRGPRYTYWVDEAPAGQQWVTGDILPGVGVKRTNYYLAGGKSCTAVSVNDGMLVAKKPRKGADSFTVNYDVGGTEYFAFWPQPLDSKGLTFTGAPLSKGMKMLGAPVVRLNLSSDKTDALVFAYLEDVAPDGTVTVVSHGRLAASHRKESRAPYNTLGMPWHSGRKGDVVALVPGKAVTMNFGMLPASRIFKAGHRLRVTLTGADPRQRNLNEIKETPPPRITVHHGASVIEIPLIPAK
jgi:putative CocE/NonD family hydrolase